MELTDFLRDARRMCEAHDGTCRNCPGDQTPNGSCRLRILNQIGVSVDEIYAVKKWSEEHPFISNKQKVIEVFGEDASLILGGMSEAWADREYKNPNKEEDEDGENIGQFED